MEHSLALPQHMNVTVNGKDTKMVIASVSEEKSQHTKIVSYLEEANRAISKAPTYREAFDINQNVEAMRAAAKAYGMSEDVQRAAGNTAVRCLLALGQALRMTFYNQGSTAISRQTEIPVRVVRNALSISRFTWMQVTAVLNDILAEKHIPTVNLVVETLAGGKPFRERKAVVQLNTAMTREQTLQIGTHTLVQALRSYANFPKITQGTYIEEVLSNSEVRSALAKALWANRKSQRALHTLLAEAHKVRPTRE